jgi:hypothetical protein
MYALMEGTATDCLPTNAKASVSRTPKFGGRLQLKIKGPHSIRDESSGEVMFGIRLALVNGLCDSKASEFMLLESGKHCTRQRTSDKAVTSSLVN